MNTIDQLIAKSEKHDELKHDHVVPLSAVSFDEAARVVLEEKTPFGGTAPMNLTNYALCQAFTKLSCAVYPAGSSKTLPADYLTRIPRDLLATILNRHVSDLTAKSAARRDRGWTVRGYGDTARAILDGRYPTKPGNTEILRMVQETLEADGGAGFGGVTLIRSEVTPDNLYLKAVFAKVNTGDGEYGLGVCIVNGEIGNRNLVFEPLIQRGVCTNTTVVDADGFSVRQIHAGNHWAEMKTILRVAINRALRISGELVNRLLAADAEQIPTFAEVLSGIKADQGWDDATFKTVVTGTEGRETRAGIVNGITYAAHKLHGDDPEAMHEMERLGGAMLVAPGSLFEAAARKYDRHAHEMAKGEWSAYVAEDARGRTFQRAMIDR